MRRPQKELSSRPWRRRHGSGPRELVLIGVVTDQGVGELVDHVSQVGVLLW
jgi:hypothetical protein